MHADFIRKRIRRHIGHSSRTHRERLNFNRKTGLTGNETNRFDFFRSGWAIAIR